MRLLILTLATFLLYLPSPGQELDTVQALVFTPHGSSIPLRKKANVDSKEIGRCNSVDSVLLLEYNGGKYYKVALTSNHQAIGYLYIDFLQYDNGAVNNVNEYNAANGSSLRLTFIEPPPGYKKQQTKSSSSQSTYYSSPSNKTIYTGPRGGRYYINKNGNKTYIKK